MLAGCFGITGGSSGISAPTGATLAEFGLDERCTVAGDTTCTDRAFDVAGQALAELGPAIPDAGPRPGQLPVGLVVQVDRDPPWEWQAADGNSGVAAAAAFDLTPFVTGDGPAVVGVADATYELSDEAAQAMVDALWVQTD